MKAYETLVEGKKGNKVAFEGELFFSSRNAVSLKGKEERILLSNIAFNGMNVGTGLTTLLATKEEVEENFNEVSMTLEEYEEKLLLESEKEEEANESDTPFQLEDLGIDLEALAREWKELSKRKEEEPKDKVEMTLWKDVFASKEDSSLWKKGDQFVLCNFAKKPGEEDFYYILSKIEVVTHPVHQTQFFNLESLTIYENNQEEIFEHFDLLEGVGFQDLQRKINKEPL